MKYEIVDFRHLVSDWYNEFLPNRCPDKIKPVENVGILYLDSVPLDGRFKADSMKFMLGKMEQIQGGDCEKTCIFVREPKPVNNVRLRPMLRKIEESKEIDDERKLKVLHVSNRRYVPVSPDVLVKQEKEIDLFLDGVFDGLSGKCVPNMKFVSSPSLDMTDIHSIMEDFFPRTALEWHVQNRQTSINVKSANEMLQPLFLYMMDGKVDDHGTLRYMAKCRQSMIEDLAKVV